ncbi:MAG: response regulator, partial [Rhodocyclaceae bacterium]|nr:response regulator [Rhodocyclaceae bacterium]
MEAAPERVELEKTRLLFRNAGMAQAVTALNGAVLLFIFGGLAPPAWALAWYAATAAMAAARYALARAFLARGPGPEAAHVWRRRALIGAAAAGSLWAAGGAAFMLADPQLTRLFAALVMAGMVGGAVPILSSVPAAFAAYSIPVMGSIIAVALLDAHGRGDWMLALVATLFLLAVNKSARYFHDVLDTSIRHALGMQEMARQLDAARRGAEAANEAKSRFLATMSHEIRTPLNGVLGMAQLLQSEDLDPVERRAYVGTILGSGRALLALLNDILDLSKIEAGKMELARATFAPGQLLDETVLLFGELAQRKGLRLGAHWQGDAHAHYWGDPGRLRQMLGNLVNNAIRFSAGGLIEIEARCEAGAPPMLRFAVHDGGPGVPADKVDRLFKPFSQVDASDTRAHGGSGLGLSIVRNLALRMGGDCGYEPRSPGSTFWIAIPAEPAPASESARPATAFSALSADAPVLALHVLVVDDVQANRMVAEAMLRKMQCSYESLQNGQEAVAAVAAGRHYDLVLMDCQMPVLDGYAATREIRRIETTSGAPRLPVVAMSAGVFEEDRRRCLEAGMDDFLPKPLDMGQLATLLGKFRALEPAARPPSAAPAPRVFDADALVACMAGDRRDAARVAAAFLADYPELLEAYAAALDGAQANEARRAAHAIRGIAATLCGHHCAA